MNLMDTWWQAGVPQFLGVHDGWAKIEPAYTSVEINVRYSSTYDRTFDEALDAPATAFFQRDPSWPVVTTRQLVEFALSRGLDVCVNMDADGGGVPFQYHRDPSNGIDEGDGRGVIPREYFAQFLDPQRYEAWVAHFLRSFPHAHLRWVEVLNEPGYQRGPDMDRFLYHDLVSRVARVCEPAGVQVIATVDRWPLSKPPMDQWVGDPALANVAVGKHSENLLHNMIEPDDVERALWSEVRAFADAYPHHQRYWDETLFVGRYPGGTTTAVGAEMVRRGLQVAVMAQEDGYIDLAGIGFANGDGEACDPTWGVCAAYINKDGTLTKGGQALVDEAKVQGVWRLMPTPEPEDVMTRDEAAAVLDLVYLALDGVEIVDRLVDAQPAQRRLRRKVRRPLRAAASALASALER